jgi:hypothetical protein
VDLLLRRREASYMSVCLCWGVDKATALYCLARVCLVALNKFGLVWGLNFEGKTVLFDNPYVST